MKAYQLAAMLQETPEADVLLASGRFGAVPFDERNIALNNEANSWIIFQASDEQLRTIRRTTPEAST